MKKSAKRPNGFVIQVKKNAAGRRRYHVTFNASGKQVFRMQPKGYGRMRTAQRAIRIAKESGSAKTTCR